MVLKGDRIWQKLFTVATFYLFKIFVFMKIISNELDTLNISKYSKFMKKLFVFFGVVTCFLLVTCSKKRDTYLKLSGFIEGKEVEISSRIQGQIKEIFVDEGERVKERDRIALIDCSDYEIQKKQIEALVESASANLKIIEKGARSEDLKMAEELKKQAEANLRSAEKDFNRAKRLFDEKSITEKQWEDAKTRYELAMANFRQAEENLKKIKRGARKEEIELARAKLKEVLALLDSVEKRIRECEILSPMDGIVSVKLREKGEMVSPGTPIVKILNTEKVYLYVYIPERDLGMVKVGDYAEVSVDSFPEKKFIGKVVFISPEAEFTPKQIQTEDERTKLVFKAKIELENKDGIFKVGMPADAFIKLR